MGGVTNKGGIKACMALHVPMRSYGILFSSLSSKRSVAKGRLGSQDAPLLGQLIL